MAVHKNRIEAGAIVRGNIRRLLKTTRHYFDEIDVTWEEDKGWVSSTFFITYRGDMDVIRKAYDYFIENLERLDSI